MKIFLLILLFPFPLPGQVTDAAVVFASPDEMKSYKSKEEDSYYENYRRQGFKPQPIEVVRRHRLKHIRIFLSADNSKAEINNTNLDKIKRDMEYLDPRNLGKESVKRNAVLSYTNTKGISATLFLDSEYDEFMWGEPGYWINLTDENGSRDYYTGLAQNHYIRLLEAGQNIWKDDSTLIVSAVRVRLTKPFIHPVSAPKYEAIENIKVEIWIPDLVRDGDNDGLTDIEEDKMMLNPLSSDADADGTSDLEDHNPRFRSRTTNETLIYKAILDNYLGDTIRIRNNKIIDSERPRLMHTLKSRTRLIVTDDPLLQNADFDYGRTIILSSKDYETSKANYPVTLDQTIVSPLFKVDDIPDTFVVSVSGTLGGGKYLIKKLVEGFDIVRVERRIH